MRGEGLKIVHEATSRHNNPVEKCQRLVKASSKKKRLISAVCTQPSDSARPRHFFFFITVLSLAAFGFYHNVCREQLCYPCTGESAICKRWGIKESNKRLFIRV